MGSFLFLIWIALSVAVGAAANARGRNGFGWFLLAIFISPLLALLFLVAFPARDSVGDIRIMDDELARNIKKSRQKSFF